VLGLVLLWILLFRTVFTTSRRLQATALENARLALLDSLTGLPNRRMLAERMRRTITEAHIPSAILMERAGEGIVRNLEEHCGPVRGKTITIFCGKGNNGGDGLVAARLLYRRRARVHVVLLATVADLSRDTATMYRRFIHIAGRSAVSRFRSRDQAWTRVSSSDILLDALLGTGLSSDVSGPYREAIELINGAGKPIIAVDIPSGIHADTGAILGQAIRATLTIRLSRLSPRALMRRRASLS